MTVQNIYKRLAEIGYSKPYLKQRILPEWWDDEITKTQSGIMEMVLYIARHLGLTYSTILATESPIETQIADANIKFKKTKSTQRAVTTEPTQSSYLQGLVHYIGALLNQSFNVLFNPNLLDAQTIRNKILTQNQYVALPQLLEFCASVGIPVIHLTDFPFKDIDGLTLKVEGRPVIFVTNKKQKFSGWLAFIIAHELGHIACGHLKNTDLLIDTKISGDNNEEQEEQEANNFASKLLMGEPNLRFNDMPTGKVLADRSRRYGNLLQIDPAMISLNYAWNDKKHNLWGAATNALKIIEPNANAPKIINQFLASYLDAERLGDHELSYLEQMMDVEMEEFELV